MLIWKSMRSVRPARTAPSRHCSLGVRDVDRARSTRRWKFVNGSPEDRDQGCRTGARRGRARWSRSRRSCTVSPVADAAVVGGVLLVVATAAAALGQGSSRAATAVLRRSRCCASVSKSCVGYVDRASAARSRRQGPASCSRAAGRASKRNSPAAEAARWPWSRSKWGHREALPSRQEMPRAGVHRTRRCHTKTHQTSVQHRDGCPRYRVSGRSTLLGRSSIGIRRPRSRATSTARG